MSIFRIFFQIIFEKNDEQIFTSLSFKISHIVLKKFCDPEAHNLTEVWTQLEKNGVIFNCFFTFTSSSDLSLFFDIKIGESYLSSELCGVIILFAIFFPQKKKSLKFEKKN